MYPLKLHSGSLAERWVTFPRSQQIIMIANEVNRLRNGITEGRSPAAIQETFERTFELVDLTVEYGSWSLRKELLRWRELFADLYIRKEDDLHGIKSSLDELDRVLLTMSPESANLIF